MDFDLQDKEDTTLREKPDYRKSVILFRRVYNVPIGAVASIKPALGTAVALRGVTGTGILTPRVLDVQEFQTPSAGTIQLRITWYQIRQYA